MAFFKIDENPGDWGRCEVDGRIVNWKRYASFKRHVGHRVSSLDGFHASELIRYWLGWL